MASGNGIDLETLFCPVTGRIKLLNTLPDTPGLLSSGLHENGDKCFSPATLAEGKIWQGDNTNSPVEVTTDSLFQNFSLQKFTTATLPVNPGKPILVFNSAIA